MSMTFAAVSRPCISILWKRSATRPDLRILACRERQLSSRTGPRRRRRGWEQFAVQIALQIICVEKRRGDAATPEAVAKAVAETVAKPVAKCVAKCRAIDAAEVALGGSSGANPADVTRRRRAMRCDAL